MLPKRLLQVGSAVGLLGIAAVCSSVGYVRSLARGHLYPIADVPHAPAALVLGARVYPDGSPSSFLRARLDLARVLLARGKIEKILVSGDHAAPEFDEPEAMRRYLTGCGIPDRKIITDAHGYDTYASCLQARDVYGLHRVTILTQSYHLPRAVGTARALGLDAVGVGDASARGLRRAWARGAVRDQLACVKTMIDLGTDHQPAAPKPVG